MSDDSRPTQPTRRAWRARLTSIDERMRGTRGRLSVTLAALIIGGFGGATMHAAVDDGHHDRGGPSRAEHEGGPPDGEHGPPRHMPGS